MSWYYQPAPEPTVSMLAGQVYALHVETCLNEIVM